MPVCHHKKTVVLVLHFDPILQRTHIVPQVQLAGRAHAAEHAFARLGGCCRMWRCHAGAEFDTNTGVTASGFRRPAPGAAASATPPRPRAGSRKPFLLAPPPVAPEHTLPPAPR